MAGSPRVSHATVVLTTHCNLRCTYCLLQPTRRRSASWPLLQSALEGVVARAGDDLTVLFTGGEPLVAFALMKRAVAHLLARQSPGRRFHWDVITNGLLLSEEAVDFLDAHGFEVTISFDGVPDAQALRGSGTFEKLDCLLRNLKRTHRSFFDRLTIAMTVSPATVSSFARSVAYFIGLGIPHLTYKPSVPGSDWKPARIRELEIQWLALAEAVRGVHERTGRIVFETDGGERPARGEWICGAADGQSATIDVDGCVYGCVVAAGSYQLRTAAVLRGAVEAVTLGPIDAPEFDERLATMPDRARACGAYTHREERYSSYRRCGDCEFLTRCSACPLAGASDPGWDDVRRVPDFVCAWNQVTLAHRDRFPRASVT